MVKGIREIIDNPDSLPSPQEIAQTVKAFTISSWLLDHERAFYNLRHGEVTIPDYTSDGQEGVVYVAYGDPARKMAAEAICSFTTHMPKTPVAFVGDSPLPVNGVDYWIDHADKDIGGRIAKLSIFDLTPDDWDYVLYLDADTVIIADVSWLFSPLREGWELVICKNPSDFHLLSRMGRPDNLDETNTTFQELGGSELLQLNGGVFAFRRCPRVAEFFRLWRIEWERWGKRDQGALHRALYRHPLRTFVLGNEWNTVTRYNDPESSAGILHYPMAARRWTGKIEGRLDSPEAWESVKEIDHA